MERRIAASRVSFMFLLTLFTLSECTDGPMCYSCQQEVKPSTCARVVRCGSHETCALERGTNLLGEVVFWSGCKDRSSCSSIKRDSSPTDVSVDCDVCCNGDFCNQAGCGEQVYTQHSGEGPLCFSCDTSTSPSRCSHVRRCRQGEMCFVETYSSGDIQLYRLGCANTTTCGTLNNRGGCNTCCKSDNCNKDCPMNTPRPTTPPPTYPKATPTRTSLSQGTHTNGLHCITCHNVYTLDSRCASHQCNPHEKCFIKKHYDGYGTPVFNMGCRSYCSSSALFGKRQSADVVKCCTSNNCNRDIYFGLVGYTSTTTSSSTTVATTRIGSKPNITSLDAGTTYARFNTNITLTCKASGNPLPKIYWTVPTVHGHPMQNYGEPSQGQLLIINIQQANEGFYTCVAENSYGRDVKGVYITVLS